VTLPELHLAGEAVAALIDGELSPVACHRALDHLARCAECCTAVTAQRQAKAALVGSPVPDLPIGLLSRLHEVPMTTDLGGSRPGALAVVDGALVWVPGEPPGGAAAPGTASPAGRGPSPGRARRGPSRPRSYPVGRARSVRLRRSLAGTLAGLAVGVVTAAAPVGTTGVGLQQSGVVTGGPQVVRGDLGGVGVRFTPRRETSTGAADRSAIRSSPSGAADVLTVSRRAAVRPG
jgi:hypothetical protein